MKNIKLKKLTTENFRDSTGSWEFNDGLNAFSGPNGSGKTTLLDAVRWVHTGKDSQGKADFELKTIKNGEQLSKIDHNAFLIYDIDGTQVEIGRVFREKWTNKRKEGLVKTGNETKYFVDGLELSAKKYDEKLLELFGDNYQLVTDINFLASMHWTKRREIVSGLIKIDEDSIIDKIEKFRELLNNRSVNDAKTYADQRKKEIKKKLTEINAGLKELELMAGNTEKIDYSQVVVTAQAKVNTTQKKIDDLTAGDKSELIDQLRSLNSELIQAENDFDIAREKARDEERKRQSEIQRLSREVETLKGDLANANADREKLLTQYYSIKERSSNSHPCSYYSESCPYFGEPINAGLGEALAEQFNIRKSEDLEKNKDDGLKVKAKIEDLSSKIEKLEADKKELEFVVVPGIISATNNETICNINNDIANLKKEIDSKNTQIPENLTVALQTAKKELEEAQAAKAKSEAYQETELRIKELKSEKETFSNESNKIELFLDKYEQYNQALADEVETPINKMFKTVNFKMFDKLENGNINPACIITDKQGRPYDGALSNGEKIQADVDIVRTLQNHFDISSSVWIDNAESVTGSIDLDCQTILLKADSKYETLTKGI